MRLLVVLVLLLGLVGCATHGAGSSPPTADLPSHWSSNQAAGGDPLSLEWFRGFGSAELDALITDAERENLDLQAADARILQADARARAAGAGLLPSLDFNASTTRLQGHSSQGSGHELDSSVLLSASYEVDFWGKNRAARDSARLLEKSSEGDRAVVALSTVTGVANTYFQVVALRENVDTSQLTLSNARKLLDLVSARRTAGIATPADLALQRAAVATAEIRVRELSAQEVEAEAALAILVGKKPGSLEVTQRTLLDFKEPHVAAGLPAELLARRPDVFSAEQTLRSAHADLVQARAAFFPTISLTATGGIQNPALQAALLTIPGAGPSSSIGAALVQTIFDGGRLRAARDEASAKEVEMLAHYRAAVLSALWDVEIALSAIDHLNQATEAQAESLSQSEVALTAAQARYQAGSGDFLTVLDAQRTVISAREQMTQYKLARLRAAVGLCKALGGGWAQK